MSKNGTAAAEALSECLAYLPYRFFYSSNREDGEMKTNFLKRSQDICRIIIKCLRKKDSTIAWTF